ncbi:SIR2 family protein [Cellvibrio sp. OA-2007]|uniref:SIR2 family protein n=1 Tax=Cellvibrio sp. OA-2007 TaxID=529823 RepID=UPI0007850A35|nr:SIR2 family protein [Cellvibrio sp. OA-2007]
MLVNCPKLAEGIISDCSKTNSWLRRDLKGILHLHGAFDEPNTCVLGIRDYEKVLQDDVRDLFQKNLVAFNQLLFIGCGDTLSDPNFSALINWMRKNLKGATPIHYALTLESEVQTRHQDKDWSGFVEPLSYGESYDDLSGFLTKHFPVGMKKKALRRKVSVDSNSIIQNYRNFLVRDCGQMTLEGVSSDMETGQRKFDLERLFVPLNVSMCPPVFPLNDPSAQESLKIWNEKFGNPMPFGQGLSEYKRIALLALPGGGKTLLLKRLAVAYSDPTRLAATSDMLPNLDLLPVLIRCREWRDYIRKPIQTLLKNVSEITGQANLVGFSDALQPMLKKGKVLLLVDGLDEIHNDADRSIFVDHVESFLTDYPKTHLVVTSREAGFNLVAPTLSRFCERLRIAPLEPEAITLLSDHWHRLMVGDSPEAIKEGNEVAKALLNRSSLRRLAENPLLLTMLLVVKHGAGALPPDRVTLYERAIEVLLDTWNIKGHEPLNHKEAVPQLAFVAYHMLCSGKQTATEKELLILLEEARERLPVIRRYAKDSPYDFLKRVELRSSLLLEAGHQLENGRAVPFYQFRHLTFQEYLAAIAATEGHYEDYRQEDTVLTPLQNYISSHEWKEVIPMAAVLAKKRAEPLLIDLISKGNELKSSLHVDKISLASSEDRNEVAAIPIGIIAQCILEEVEASVETINSMLHLIAFFGRWQTDKNILETIGKGPYSRELYAQAFSLFEAMDWHGRGGCMNTCAAIAVSSHSITFWESDAGIKLILSLMESKERVNVSYGLLICMGMLWVSVFDNETLFSKLSGIIPLEQVHRHITSDDPVIWGPAMWIANLIWSRDAHRNYEELIDLKILDLHLQRLIENDTPLQHFIAHGMASHIGIERDFWRPVLNESQVERIIKMDSEALEDSFNTDALKAALFFIAFHSRAVWSDEELLSRFRDRKAASRYLRGTFIKNHKLQDVYVALGGDPAEFETLSSIQ